MYPKRWLSERDGPDCVRTRTVVGSAMKYVAVILATLLVSGVAQAEIPIPRERPDTCEYDARHREPLSDGVRSRLPDRCIEDLEGDYPTRAAAWLAAIERELKAVPQTKHAEVPLPPGAPCTNHHPRFRR